MLKYLRESFKRKIARRSTKKYGFKIVEYELPKEGKVQFAKWNNPIYSPDPPAQSDVDFFKRFVTSGSLAIDIGANVGDTTLSMALAAGPEGLIVGLDPNPYAFDILSANASLNKGKTNIDAYNVAVTADKRQYYFHSSEASFGNGGISTDPDSKEHGSFALPHPIEGVILEKFLASNYSTWLDRLSFIKIDAEGYDIEILKSITSLIEKHQPVILAECFGNLPTNTKQSLFDILDNLGFKLMYTREINYLPRDRGNIEDEELTSTDMVKDFTYNFYAVPRTP